MSFMSVISVRLLLITNLDVSNKLFQTIIGFLIIADHCTMTFEDDSDV